MRILEELFHKSKDGAVVAAAVQSWTLLLSIAPDHVIPSLFARSAFYDAPDSYCSTIFTPYPLGALSHHR